VLITAQNLYYPIDAVPEFWEWLVHMGNAGEIKMPIETLEEVKDGSNDAERDLLFAWIQDDAHKAAILFGENVQPALVQRVTNQYAPVPDGRRTGCNRSRSVFDRARFG
jgi:hypothetical protein